MHNDVYVCMCLINNNALPNDLEAIKLKAAEVIVKYIEATGWYFKSIVQSYKCNASDHVYAFH